MKKKVLILSLTAVMLLLLLPSMALAAPKSKLQDSRLAFFGNVQSAWCQKLTQSNGVARKVFFDSNVFSGGKETKVLHTKGFAKKLTGTVTTDSTSLTVRQGPDTAYRALGFLPKGTKVNVLAEVTTDNPANPVWYQIEYEGTGYISKEYIILDADGKSGTITTQEEGTMGNLIVHETESLESEVIGRVSKGNTVDVLEETEETYKIAYEETGYVSSAYMAVTAKTVSLTGLVKVHSTPLGWTQDLLPAGKEVTVLKQVGDWYKVSYGEKTGYIYRLYLK